jgi:hypothetical protein
VSGEAGVVIRQLFPGFRYAVIDRQLRKGRIIWGREAADGWARWYAAKYGLSFLGYEAAG